MKKQQISRRKELIFTAILLFLSLSVCAGFYLGTIVWRCKNSLSEYHRWNRLEVYSPDENYGYFPTADTLAYQSLKYGERVPVLFDENGFRIPVDETEPPLRLSQGRILFLGGSFTHGSGVLSEKTFTYLTANALDMLANK